MALYKNAMLRGKNQTTDILVKDGKFAKIGKCCEAEGEEVIDLKGKLVCEPYCDPHIHLDYVFTASSFGENSTGTLFDGIASWSDSKSTLSADIIKQRARKGLKEQLLGGTQYIRTHVDVTDPNLTGLKAMLELREEVKDLVEIQIVAFPQEGMYSYKGGEELVEEALKMGADCVSAIPHFEYTPEMGVKSVKKAVELAVKYDKMVDAHCDETDDDMSRFVEVLAYEAMDKGIGEKTTASHTCAMGSYNNAYAFKLMKLLKKSGINLISCPTENTHLQGRYDTYPKRRGLTRIKEMFDEGINVCFAQDSICDPWYPLGNGNLTYVLDSDFHGGHLTSPQYMNKALDLISANGAKTMCLGESYFIRENNPASFIVIDAVSDFDALRNRAGVLMSVRNGRVLFKKQEPTFETPLAL
ncbi:MAG: cytosine deaminase [Oscillospiraceae bacterium]|nr:cytosine deaminase [Oscillospiraceae bacterium]